VFFVGAGISVLPPSRLPTFIKLNEELIRLATSNVVETNAYTFLCKARPEVVLQILVDVLGREVLESLEVFVTSEPNLNHFLLAEALKEGICVFTTNYDNLIERACECIGLQIGKDIHVLFKGEDFENFIKKYKGEVPRRFLFKLHGAIDVSERGEKRYESIRATLRQLGRGLGYKAEVLRFFLQNFDFCFMGYSCLDDFDIYPLLLTTTSDKSVFWFDYDEGEIGELVWGKERLMAEKEREEVRPPRDKDRETINVNRFLLTRKKCFKFVGNTSQFVKELLYASGDRPLVQNVSTTKAEDHPMPRWATKISKYEKNLIAARLYLSLKDFSNAEKHFEQAIKATENEKDKAVAQYWLAQCYYEYEKREGYEKAVNILMKEALPTFEKVKDVLWIACTKTTIANNLRRLAVFFRAQEFAEDARQLFEKDKEKLARDEEFRLEYARCLNILGLIYYRLNPDKYLEKALELCRQSKEIRLSEGDISAAADSENAVALILREEALRFIKLDRKRATSLLNQAMGNLERVIYDKESVGDYRACAYANRNLGLSHNDLGNLAETIEEREKCIRQAIKDYESGIEYAKMVIPVPPLDLELELRFRQGECYTRLSDEREIEKGVDVLHQLESKWFELKNWHNEVRTLSLLLNASRKIKKLPEAKNHGLKILDIYEDVLRDSAKLKAIIEDPVKWRNAQDILRDVESLFESIGLTQEFKRCRRVLEALAQKISQK
jgi:tetratricopeptide (TPR) repeat protein